MIVICMDPDCKKLLDSNYQEIIMMKWKNKNLVYCDMICAMNVFNGEICLGVKVLITESPIWTY